MGKKIEGTVLNAEVTKNPLGIALKIQTNNGKYIMSHSTTKEPWLKIPEGLDPETELQKVCDLFNGYSYEKGEKKVIPNFKLKKVTIVEEL